MSDEFILKDSYVINWDITSRDKILSDEFILEHYKKLDSTKIFRFQKFSETTIKELQEWFS